MNWTIEKLQSLITDQVEESLTLEYKAAAALARTDGKKAEITISVSSFANSAGGTIIYGMKEYDQSEKRYLPERIDPVNRTQFSKEWLEQIINNIRPRIENIVIHPVATSPNSSDVVFVVEIPQSTTAHQAFDLKYYKRYNFESIPMYDHEIRDVLARGQHPIVNLEFNIVAESLEHTISPGIRFPLSGPPSFYDSFNLHIRAKNSGSKYAHYVNVVLRIPTNILHESEHLSRTEIVDKDSNTYVEFYTDNTSWSPKFGPGPYDPILPTRSMTLKTIGLIENYDKFDKSNLIIDWSVYADNASPVYGKIAVNDIQVVDKRDRSVG